MKKVILSCFLSFSIIALFGQLKVHSPGDVGIGFTTSPDGKFHVKGGNAIFEQGSMGIGTNAPQRTLHVAGTNALVRIDRRGASGPGFQLVNQTSSGVVEKNFVFVNAGTGTGTYFYIADSGTNVTGANTRRFVINGTTGNVAIGSSTNPVEKLTVSGGAYKTSGGSSWSIPSDRRLKNNISDFENGLNVIMKINPVKYNYNGLAGTKSNGGEEVGIIAQELQKVAPFMVKTFSYTEDSDNGIDNTDIIEDTPESIANKTTKKEYLSVNDSSIKYILINAVKEQQEIISSLEKRIKLLEERLK